MSRNVSLVMSRVWMSECLNAWETSRLYAKYRPHLSKFITMWVNKIIVNNLNMWITWITWSDDVMVAKKNYNKKVRVLRKSLSGVKHLQCEKLRPGNKHKSKTPIRYNVIYYSWQPSTSSACIRTQHSDIPFRPIQTSQHSQHYIHYIHYILACTKYTVNGHLNITLPPTLSRGITIYIPSRSSPTNLQSASSREYLVDWKPDSNRSLSYLLSYPSLLTTTEFVERYCPLSTSSKLRLSIKYCVPPNV